MNRRGLLFAVVIGLAVVVLVPPALLWWQRDAVQERIVQAVNRSLDTELHVDGGMDLRLFKRFPLVSLELRDASIHGLCDLGTVHVQAHPLELLRDAVRIHAIAVSDGWITIHRTADGTNLDAFASSNSTEAPTGSPTLALERIEVQDVRFAYLDEVSRVSVRQTVYDLHASLDLTDGILNIPVRGDLTSDSVHVDGRTFVRGVEVRATGSVGYHLADRRLALSDLALDLDGNALALDGTIDAGGGRLDLTASTEGTDLGTALHLVPEPLASALPRIDGTGDHSLDVRVNGPFADVAVSARFRVQDGTVVPGHGVDDQVSLSWLSGSYTSADDRLAVDSFALSAPDLTARGSVRIDGLRSPVIHLQMTGRLEAGLLDRHLPLPDLRFTAGGADLVDVAVRIDRRDTTLRVGGLAGRVVFDTLRAERPAEVWTIDGPVVLDGTAFTTTDLRLTRDGVPVRFAGTVANLPIDGDVPRPMRINGRIHTPHWTVETAASDAEPNDATQHSRIAVPLVTGSLLAEADTLDVGDMRLRSARAQLRIDTGSIDVVDIHGNGLGGSLDAQGAIHLPTRRFGARIALRVAATDIDLEALFAAWNDFGQDAITHENLGGTASFAGLLTLDLDTAGAPDLDALLVDGNLRVVDGRLTDLDALTELSGFLKEEQLADIRFDDLTTSITIAEGRMLLGETVVRSNVVTLTVAGEHGFDDVVDYRIDLNLRNVLAARFRARKTLDEGSYNDAQGGVNLLVRIHGPLSDPTVAIDRERMRAGRRDEWSSERDEWRRLLETDEVLELDPAVRRDDAEIEYLDWDE